MNYPEAICLQLLIPFHNNTENSLIMGAPHTEDLTSARKTLAIDATLHFDSMAFFITLA